MSEIIASALSVIKNCEFCLEQETRRENQYALRYQETLPNRTVFLSPHFRVFPSLGQISEGHVLITPLRHYTAMADMPLEMISDLENICNVVRSALEQIYGQCVFFEHGTRTSECGGCGIYHAHTHAVPIASGRVFETLRERFALSALGSLSKLQTAVPPERSYLFFEDTNANRFITVADYLPSQYMRKLLADSIGKSDWDWREVGFEPELLRTFNAISCHLQSLTASPELRPQ